MSSSIQIKTWRCNIENAAKDGEDFKCFSVTNPTWYGMSLGDAWAAPNATSSRLSSRMTDDDAGD